jgi:hypothetical protein
MMARDDDDAPKTIIAHAVGQDLSLLSVDELTARVGLLHRAGMTDVVMVNAFSTQSHVYATLRFSIYNQDCPRLDTEWLLSLCLTPPCYQLQSRWKQRLFFWRVRSRHRAGNHINPYRWTPAGTRAMICSS